MFSVTVKIGSSEKSVKEVAKAEVRAAKAPATHKLNAHLVCILIGVAITIVCTFIDTSIILHIGGLLATLPAFIQEGIDWLRDW